MTRRYRRKSAANSIISDSAVIGSRLPWWGALTFGLVTFLIFYFFIPSFLEAKLAEQSANRFYSVYQVIFEHRMHWFEWIGIACLLIGIFFGVRNYFINARASYQETWLVSFLAKIFSRNLD